MPEPTDTPLTGLADAAFRQAAAEVVRRAQRTGTPLIVWEGGRVQALPPEDVQPSEARPPATTAAPGPR